MFIIIDESGDLEPGKGTEYFVICMVLYYKKNLSEINKIIGFHNNYLWNNGWPKNCEIKATNLYNYKRIKKEHDFSNLKINPRLCLRDIYKDINDKLDIKSGFIIHKPANQGPNFRCLHKEKIYNYLSKNLYNECFEYLEDNMDIFADQRNITLVSKRKAVNLTVQRLNLDYIGYIQHELTYQFAFNKNISPKINITFENSKRLKSLQVADYLAWEFRKKYEGKPCWYNLLSKIEKVEIKDNF